MGRLCFSILDIDGDGLLSIVDLIWLTNHFSKTTTVLGQQVYHDLYEQYMVKNVTQNFAKQHFDIDCSTFCSMMRNLPLI